MIPNAMSHPCSSPSPTTTTFQSFKCCNENGNKLVLPKESPIHDYSPLHRKKIKTTLFFAILCFLPKTNHAFFSTVPLSHNNGDRLFHNWNVVAGSRIGSSNGNWNLDRPLSFDKRRDRILHSERRLEMSSALEKDNEIALNGENLDGDDADNEEHMNEAIANTTISKKDESSSPRTVADIGHGSPSNSSCNDLTGMEEEANDEISNEEKDYSSSPRTLADIGFRSCSNSSSSSSNELTGTEEEAANDEIMNTRTEKKQAVKRRMELSWCGPFECYTSSIRETLVGPDDHITFDGPATGQVMYGWVDEEDDDHQKEEENPSSDDTALVSVLFLVKKNSDELYKVAADAVTNLTSCPSTGKNIRILLDPELAAKLKYYFGVGNDQIELWEPQPVPGFGNSQASLNNPQDMKKTMPWLTSAISGVNNPDDATSTTTTEEQEEENKKMLEKKPTFPNLVCTIGGDGLLMHANSLFPGPVPPILCIAGGSMGFLTPFTTEEMVEAIQKSLGLRAETHKGPEDVNAPSAVLPGVEQVGGMDDYWGGAIQMTHQLKSTNIGFGTNYRICLSMRMRLDCSIINTEGVIRARYNVLNEVVIDRGSSPYLANLECFCDDVHLTTVQADGIIFSTPTGSTAYSMAAGGSVVHPAVPAILVTPICPHVLSFRSMVFPDHVVLRCFVPYDARAGACVAFDGKNRRELHRGEGVQIQMSVHPVPTINRVDQSFDWLDSLKRNFNFNARIQQKPL